MSDPEIDYNDMTREDNSIPITNTEPPEQTGPVPPA